MHLMNYVVFKISGEMSSRKANDPTWAEVNARWYKPEWTELRNMEFGRKERKLCKFEC